MDPNHRLAKTTVTLNRPWVKRLYFRYCQWQHTIFYMVACRLESQLKPQTKSLKRFCVSAVHVSLNVTQKITLTKVSLVCFLVFECLCVLFYCVSQSERVIMRLCCCCFPGCKVKIWTQRPFQDNTRVASSENKQHFCGKTMKSRFTTCFAFTSPEYSYSSFRVQTWQEY